MNIYSIIIDYKLLNNWKNELEALKIAAKMIYKYTPNKKYKNIKIIGNWNNYEIILNKEYKGPYIVKYNKDNIYFKVY